MRRYFNIYPLGQLTQILPMDEVMILVAVCVLLVSDSSSVYWAID